MSKKGRTFIELCLEGEALLEEIDDFIDEWHSSSDGREIHGFLGMTKDEYAFWVSEPSSLAYIVAAHKQKRSVRAIVEENSIDLLPMAARAADPDQARRLMKWLERHSHK
jgi:hypothetical protein